MNKDPLTKTKGRTSRPINRRDVQFVQTSQLAQCVIHFIWISRAIITEGYDREALTIEEIASLYNEWRSISKQAPMACSEVEYCLEAILHDGPYVRLIPFSLERVNRAGKVTYFFALLSDDEDMLFWSDNQLSEFISYKLRQGYAYAPVI